MHPAESTVPAAEGSAAQVSTLDEVVSKHIRKVLSRTGGKIHGTDGAAALLGINASTLRNRMNKLGISYRKKELSQFRNAQNRRIR